MLETAQQLSSAPRANGSSLAHTWRLVRWQLFLTRRRALTKVLASIYLIIFVLTIGFVLLAYASSSSTSQEGANQFRDLLTFPTSLGIVTGYVSFMGVLTLCALAGAVIGGEYGFSTQRLAFSRGVGRGQMVAAQVSALAVLALLVAGISYLLGTLTGVTIGPALGGSVSWPQASGWEAIALSWLANSAELFAYMLLAAFFATLGRSVVAGVVFSLGFYLAERILNGVLTAIEFATVGPQAYLNGTRDWLGHIPDWLLGNNTSELINKAGSGTISISSGATISAPDFLGVGHAVLVVVVYCVVLMAASYFLLRTRDITD
jgi:ABC-type transport system involved in multi-copper enzyme maturation permease subunit